MNLVALVKDIAIVLRRLDYSETSQVLAMFTRLHGQQRLIARGIKRSTKTRVAVGIDLLELGRVVFSQRSGKEDRLATLTEWHQEENFAHIRQDLPRCYAAQYAAEVTSHLTEVHDPHPGLFDGLHRFLLALKREDALAALAGYMWLMLTEIGLRPELSRCVGCNRDIARSLSQNCGTGVPPVVHHGRDARATGGLGISSKDEPLYFSARQGGVICRDCEPAVVEKRRISAAAARSLATTGRADKAQARPAFDLLDYHVTEIMARRPRLSGMLLAALENELGRRD